MLAPSLLTTYRGSEFNAHESCTDYLPDYGPAGVNRGPAGAKTSMAPLASRACKRGNGAGAVGSWWVSSWPAGENDVE